jgi:ribosomal protein S18 acetylase RimI-like enzyme
VTIRDYRPADYPAVRDCFIELQEVERALDARVPAGAPIAEAYLRGLFERCETMDGRVFVAEAEGRVIGYACVLGTCRPDGPDDDPAPTAYLDDLVVLPRFRGRGHGRALLQRAEEYATAWARPVLRLCVKGGNHNARAFYARAGFLEYELLLERQLRPSTAT